MGRRWGNVAFGALVLSDLGFGRALAQSDAKLQAGAATLPSVTVQSPSSSKLRALPRHEARHKLATVARAAPAQPAAPAATFGSGSPNAGSGPTAAPSMASETSFTGEELNARP